MHLPCVVFLLCHFCRSFPVVADPVKVQIQQWGVVGGQQLEEQVLLNGVSFTSHKFNTVISPDTLLAALISANKTSALRNHTILRLQQCVLEGSRLQWNDRVLIDGQVYLTLEQNNTWTVHVPQALALKAVWDQGVQRTRAERVHLQEGCIKLMKDLKLSEEQSDPDIPHIQFLIPIVAVTAFGLLTTFSIFIYKMTGLRHPGGIIGSIVHYPRDMTGMYRGIV